MKSKEETRKIKLSDKHYLRIDSNCMWIEEAYISDGDKTKGRTVYKRVSGYCRDYETVMKTFYDNKCRDIDVNTAKQYLKAMASERAKTRKMIKNLLGKGE